jgi:biotin-dependent carboxylase-like uncharacterized protein
MLSTVQDLGRFHYRLDGVVLGGALDDVAHQVANWMVGNSADAATLEITLGGVKLRFLHKHRFSLTGADCDAELDGKKIRCWWSYIAQPGQVLHLRAPRFGMRTMLAVRGGIDVPLVLGSYSTNLKASFGGMMGRALKSGDTIAVRSTVNLAWGVHFNPTLVPSTNEGADLAFGIVAYPAYGSTLTDSPCLIRVIPGPEYVRFDDVSQHACWNCEYKITASSDRTAYRLAGAPLVRRPDKLQEMLSHAVFPGVIQVPPSGQPIILLKDAQTTGGYPKLGVVIAADLWRLAQLPLGARLQLVPVTAEDARMAAEDLSDYLSQVKQILSISD